MRYGLIETTLNRDNQTTALALDPGKTRLHLKSHSFRDDQLVDDWIYAAAQHFYEQTGRLPLQESMEYWLERFPSQDRIQLPCPPLVSVESVEYLDENDEWQSFDDGASPAVASWEAKCPAGIYAPRGWVQLKTGYSWPSGAGRIRFTGGYGASSDDVPELVQSLLRKIVTNFDQFRSTTFVPITGSAPVTVPGFEQMIQAFKFTALPTIIPRCL